MHSLVRICLQNWYLVDALDIEVVGEAALIGPTGAGKSSIQDAIQTVVTGANQNRLNLNPSASGKSSRSVLEYCLGMTGDPGEGAKPLRSACETVLALVFRDGDTDEPITVGVALSARLGDSREEVISRFIVPGLAYSVEGARRRTGSSERLADWAETAAAMRRDHPGMEEYKTSAERFTADMLSAMRGSHAPPNVKHFLRAFSNALAFKPIFDPTLFVRDFVLEPDPLDVARVRTSIATWRELEGMIADVEAKLRRVSRVADRFRLWGRARMKADANRFVAAAADARRAAHDVSAARRTFAERNAELSVERGVLSSRRQWIRNWDEEIRSKQALLASGSSAGRMRQIEVETSMAERDAREAEQAWLRIRGALSDLSKLSVLSDFMRPAQARAVDAARQALSLTPDGTAPHEALRNRGQRLQALIDEAVGVDGWQDELDERADKLSEEIRGLQVELERSQEGVTRTRGGMLSREAMRLLNALEGAGIPAVPVCDVVGVVDTEWQYAAEALLGRGREAVIVPPGQLQRAFDLMWRERDTYAGCTLVKTSATPASRQAVQKGSILEALSTEDPHAAAFLAVRIGAFRKAETEAELDRMDRGVMRDGKTSSGMGLSVQRSLRELLLGRGPRETDAETLRNDVSHLNDRLFDAKGRMRLCREAARIVPGVAATLRSSPGPFELEHALLEARRRQEAFLKDRRSLDDADDAGLRQEMLDIQEDRDLHAKELEEEVEPRVEELVVLVADARAKLGVAIASLRSAVGQRRKAWAALASETGASIRAVDPEIEEPEPTEVCRRFREEARREEAGRRDVRAWLASFRNDARIVAESAEGEARREQLGALRDLTEYSANWNVTIPANEGDSPVASYRWTMEERTRLEGNELRGYREACNRAAEEMRTMLREDLLARLSEKLGKVSDRLEAINALLARHRFTGQTYAFTSAVEGRFERMHGLATKAAAGELTEDAFAEAMDDVEAMIEGADDAALLADYRQYFTFEIVMTDAAGGRTTLSARAVKGSGGEAQVPFYVAIAASLASAYFPGGAVGKPTGMGLALFDEAFNKLDVPNTQALLQFFRDMGLQLVIAGPEDKRATFTEVLDTIILVNKSLDGRSVFVDTEFPKAAAKRGLAQLNPDHRGIEGFRPAAE